MKQLYAIKKWAQEVPHGLREGTMNIWRTKAATYQTPVTITPKRKRREVTNDAMDREDDQEDEERGGGESETERETPRDTQKEERKHAKQKWSRC